MRWSHGKITVLFLGLVRLLTTTAAGDSSTPQVHTVSQNQCIVRGGEFNHVALEEEFPTIRQFLSDVDRQTSLSRFHIHGWRWHTASLVRESGRLCNLAQKAKLAVNGGTMMSTNDTLQKAIDYVVGFNMKGLHRIEADLMFPWMREKLTSSRGIEPKLSQEFATIMAKLESSREHLVDLGKSLIESSATITDNSASIDQRLEAIQIVITKSASLQTCAKSMMEIENNLLVPAIGKIVPESEQHSFNNKVLMNLGLWDSRLHLVAMYEAIEESGNRVEKSIFEQAIPSIPQMMIPRWKRKLYEPKAGVLDAEL